MLVQGNNDYNVKNESYNGRAVWNYSDKIFLTFNIYIEK